MTLTRDQEGSIAKIRVRLTHLVQWIKERNGPQFDADLIRRVKVVDASSAGRVVFEVDVGQEYSNNGGIMHGGAAALILDNLTSWAFVPLMPLSTDTKAFVPPGGMTRALNMTYLRPLPLPASIRVQSEVIQNGRSTSLARGTILSKDGKKIYFTCEHHKINAQGFNRATPSAESKDSKL